MSQYRVLMVVVFSVIVMVEEWSGRHLAAGIRADLIGAASVTLWACTLLGSYGIGPVAAMWDLLRK